MSERSRATAIGALRTLLFAPADDLERLTEARASRAGAVIADLEDAVAPARKGVAREGLGATLHKAREQGLQLVRINGSPELAERDLEALRGLTVDAVVVPKAEPKSVARAAQARFPIIALIESAKGVRSAFELASARRVVRLMLGTVDLGAELATSPLAGGLELLYTRSRLVLDSAAASIAPPIDGVVVDVKDQHLLREETARAKALGFGAKACIHPRQLAVVEEIFTPTDAEVAWARAVTSGYESALARGDGVLTIEGEMIDAAVVKRAERMLSQTDNGN